MLGNFVKLSSRFQIFLPSANKFICWQWQNDTKKITPNPALPSKKNNWWFVAINPDFIQSCSYGAYWIYYNFFWCVWCISHLIRGWFWFGAAKDPRYNFHLDQIFNSITWLEQLFSLQHDGLILTICAHVNAVFIGQHWINGSSQEDHQSCLSFSPVQFRSQTLKHQCNTTSLHCVYIYTFYTLMHYKYRMEEGRGEVLGGGEGGAAMDNQ